METLPEASSEEESLTTNDDNDHDEPTPDTLPPIPPQFSSLSRGKSRSAASLEALLEGSQHHHGSRRKRFEEEFTDRRKKEEECESQDGHKIFLLQSIIQQLRDELRECRDQNELLEFRLLEIEEAPSSSSSSSNNKQVGLFFRSCIFRKQLDISCPSFVCFSLSLSHIGSPFR